MNESEHAAYGGLAAALSQIKRAHPDRHVQVLVAVELDREGLTLAAEIDDERSLADVLQAAADRARELGR